MTADIIFPQELVNSFIEHLSTARTDDQEDRELQSTLASCALVSQSFSAPARRRLFSIIRLSQYNPPNLSIYDLPLSSRHESLIRRIQTLNKLLSDNQSDLIDQIQELQIEVATEAIFDARSGLEHLLRLLSIGACNLTIMGFRGCWGCQVPWKRIGKDITISLRAICRSESVKRLLFAHLKGFPADLITNCNSLQYLRFDYVSLAGVSGTTHDSLTNKVALKDLHVYHSLSNFWQQISRFHQIISTIRTFGASLDNGKDVSAFVDIVQQASKSLVSIDLLLNGEHNDFLIGQFAKVGPLPALREVTLRSEVGYQIFRLDLHTTQVMVFFLNHAIIPKNIETIKLYFGANVQRHHLDTLLPAQDEGLMSLGCFVLERKYAHLRKILFHLNLRVDEVISGPPAAADLQQATGSLKSQITSLFFPSDYAADPEMDRIVTVRIELKVI